METPQGSDWMPIMPHWFKWPQASVVNVTWADEDFRTMLYTLCKNYLSYSICNYVASTALMGTVFAF